MYYSAYRRLLSYLYKVLIQFILMKEIFRLSPLEKIAQKMLLILLILLMIVILKGVYNQDHKISQDSILIPCMYVIGILFLSIYTINSFTSGNIVRNWIIGNRLTGPVFHSVLSIIKKSNKLTPDNAIILTTKIFGTISLCITLILFYKFLSFLLQ